MPIRPPALDDRGFDDLVTDLVRRIPPTTSNGPIRRDGDPGRTLIDLFAWLGDTILYRANLSFPSGSGSLSCVSSASRCGRPCSARGLIQVSIADPATTAPVTLPPRSAITKPVHFELESELTVQPVEGSLLHQAPARQPRDRADFRPDRRSSTAVRRLGPDLGLCHDTGLRRRSAAGTGRPRLRRPGLDKCLWVALLGADTGSSRTWRRCARLWQAARTTRASR